MDFCPQLFQISGHLKYYVWVFVVVVVVVFESKLRIDRLKFYLLALIDKYAVQFQSLEQVAMIRSSHRKCSIKKLFLEISQNSQENTCVF